MNKELLEELSRIQLLSARYKNKSRMCPLEVKKEEIRCYLIDEYIKEIRQENNQLKEVIEEVREYIESKNNGVCRVNGEEKPAYTFLLDFREAREFVWELLQILDKVKENK